MGERFITSIVRNVAGAWGAVEIVHKAVEVAGTSANELLKAGAAIGSPELTHATDLYVKFGRVVENLNDPGNVALAGVSLAILVAGDMAWRPRNEHFSGWVIRSGLSIVAAGAVTLAPAVLDVMRSGAPVTFEPNVLPIAGLALLVAGGKMLLGSIMRRNATVEYSVHSRGQNRPRQLVGENFYADGTRKLEKQKTPRSVPLPKEPAEHLPQPVELRAFNIFVKNVQSGQAGSDNEILDTANYFEDRFERAELFLQPRDVGDDDGKIEPEDLPRYTDIKNGLEVLRSKAVQIGTDAAGRLWPYPERPE